jgi:hypothetical protein
VLSLPTPAEASAVIVTRGDVDLLPILDSLQDFDELIVWDNAQGEDLAVYGRYAGVLRARNPLVYVQDDDCLVDAAAVVAAYQPGRVVANMPLSRWDDYPDSCLVGWGAVFDACLPARAFARFERAVAPPPDWRQRFYRDCDLVFTVLTPHDKIDLGFAHLPWAESEGRLFRQPDHYAERQYVLGLARGVRDA